MGVHNNKQMKTIIALAIVLAFVQYAAAGDTTAVEEEFTEVDKHSKYHGCAVKCHVPTCTVIVFQHCNYHGYRIHLKPGNYNMHQLQRKGMRNDDLSSIQVHGNCKATLFEHHNFSGRSKAWTRHDSCFTNDHMVAPASFLSIKVEEHTPTETELVQTKASANWGRRRRARRRRSWNDQVSSIKVNNMNGKICHYDCRERDHKLKEKSHKAQVRAEKAQKHHKAKQEKKAKAAEKSAKAKIAADKKREKAAKKKAAAAKKKKELGKKRWLRYKKHEAAKKKKTQEMRRKHYLKIKENRMKRFKKNKKKLSLCAKGTRVHGRKANHFKGMCRSFRRFCYRYRKAGLWRDAKYMCHRMRMAHKHMVRHMKRAPRHHHRHHRPHLPSPQPAAIKRRL